MDNQSTTLSEKLTTPLGRGLSGTAATVGTLLAANKLMGTKKAGELFARMGSKAPIVSNKGIAGAALGSGGLSALMADFDRDLYAKHLANKIRRGGKDFTGKEKALLGNALPAGPTTAGKGFAEHYFTPTSMGAFRGVLGGVMGGFSPMAAAEGALAGAGGTALNKAIMAQALKDRISSGKELRPSEQVLARYLRSRNA